MDPFSLVCSYEPFPGSVLSVVCHEDPAFRPDPRIGLQDRDGAGAKDHLAKKGCGAIAANDRGAMKP